MINILKEFEKSDINLEIARFINYFESNDMALDKLYTLFKMNPDAY